MGGLYHVAFDLHRLNEDPAERHIEHMMEHMHRPVVVPPPNRMTVLQHLT
jgi:hypothetical protein